MNFQGLAVSITIVGAAVALFGFLSRQERTAGGGGNGGVPGPGPAPEPPGGLSVVGFPDLQIIPQR